MPQSAEIAPNTEQTVEIMGGKFIMYLVSFVRRLKYGSTLFRVRGELVKDRSVQVSSMQSMPAAVRL